MEDFFEEDKDKIHYRRVGGRIFDLLLSGWPALTLAVFFLIVSTLTKLAGPVIIRHAIDVDLTAKNYSALLGTLALFMGNALAFLYFNYKLLVRLEFISQEIMVELKTGLLRHIMGLHLSFFDKTPVGRLSARVESDTDTLHQLFTETVVIIFRDLFMLFGTVGVMAYFNLKLTLIAASLTPLVLLYTVIFVKKSTPMFIGARKTAAEVSGFLTEHIGGMSVIQAFNRQQATAIKLEDINKRKFTLQFKAEFWVVLFYLSSLFMEPVAISLIIGFGGAWAMKGALTVGTLVMFIIYVEQLFEPILHLSEHLSIIQRSFAAGQRIFNILDTKNEIKDPANPHFLSRIERGIEFKDVKMRYSEESPWVLKGISLRVPKSSRCAIVGETGGGKSTIINLLFRFYLPSEGKITIDGVGIDQMSTESIRSVLGLVQQDIYLFPGTLLDNLKLMDSSIPDARVHDAIRSMELGHFFEKHPLKKEIIEKGANLSTGERQVISLVRAMVLDPPALVLDEATASMDPYTEKMIQKATDRLFRDRTVIVIAHRLSTVKNADQILVVSKGEIMERGTHDELLRTDGIYSRLFRLQFGDNGN